MYTRVTFMAAALSLALTGAAQAVDVFSGVASPSGEGLIVPQTLVAGGGIGFDTRFDSGLGAPLALVTTVDGGSHAEGLAAFPLGPDGAFELQTRLTPGDVLWGLTPYVGLGVTSTPNADRVFQGIPSLLPYEGDTIGLQGVAGIAYELMPGIGAGLEYRYQGYTASTPVAGDASSNQTIMMRLDLGLN
jgi:opacity protein-like surface antigen